MLLGAAAIIIAGEDVPTAYLELVRGAVGTPANLATTLVRSIPIVVTAVGIGIAFRAGAINLGAEGQMILGGLATAVVALALQGFRSRSRRSSASRPVPSAARHGRSCPACSTCGSACPC